MARYLVWWKKGLFEMFLLEKNVDEQSLTWKHKTENNAKKVFTFGSFEGFFSRFTFIRNTQKISIWKTRMY